MHTNSTDYQQTNLLGEALVLAGIFRAVFELAERDPLAADDALDDAFESVREYRNRLNDPATRVLLEANVDPMVCRVSEVTGHDLGFVRSVAYAALPSKARIVLDVLRRHLAAKPKIAKPSKRFARGAA